ncbi:MAG: inorganic phosphate transporter, partial [Gemmatimonadales bacterium]|nr:inorganic phosphate transporter [Gemmatimonadales bacterium]
LSAGLTSLLRGLNDAPKMLALGLVAAAGSVSGQSLYVLVALAMGAGSYVAGSRVTATLAGKVTKLSPDDGFAANLVTSVLVGAASGFSLPVSTTHVSSSAVIGVGMHRGNVRWRMVRDMALAWLVTVPLAGVVAAAAYSVAGLWR